MTPTSLEVNLTTISTESTSYTPWSTFGPLQYFEVIYLLLVAVVGTIGNLIVILSIIYGRRVHTNGNIFIINLSLADLLVTGFVIPTVMAAVIKGGEALGDTACKIVGVTVTVSCTCSICNLMLIAANRCCSIATPMKYHSIFSSKKEYMMAFGIWVWGSALSSPTLFGWGGIKYEPRSLTCAWDEKPDVSYTIFITVFAVFIPLFIIGVCYTRLYFAVVKSAKRVRSISVMSTSGGNDSRSLNTEQRLLRTLITTVVVFVICWVPFGFDVLLQLQITPQAKKVIDWLVLTNSSVNFFIYGALNSGFRQGYKDLLVFIFCCRLQRRRSFTTRNHMNYLSDSYNSTRRAQNNVISQR